MGVVDPQPRSIEAVHSRTDRSQMFVCEECRKRTESPPHTSFTGRELCSDCHARLLGAAAGGLSAGGGASLETTVSSAVATSGTFAWVRRFRRKKLEEKS